MSTGNVDTQLARKLPLDKIAEICQKHGVSELSVYGLENKPGSRSGEEVLFLVMFQNDDFGPWGSKLDDVQNDLSGVMHHAIHVASRRGIEQSSPPARRDHILATAQRVYES